MAQKLNVKPGQAALGQCARKISETIVRRACKRYLAREPKNTSVDVLQVFVRSRIDLEHELAKVRELVADRGIVWVTCPKVSSSIKSDLNRDNIRADAKKFGLERVAIFSVDNDWSALRLKIV